MRKNNDISNNEVNQLVNKYLENNEVKNMGDIEKMMSTFFGPAIQRLLEAEMDAKIKYDNALC